ncbi:Spore germination protein A3 [Neomoorella glycerini]|uniref:Spore germination protein A3 n=1 Tax=Neomoorella glycerini TaxID=55779 RepID=A0A6I5ZP42_9FIRM|nr:Ger(x)C family spore germination protein [Moorella glycerini]QGP91291.1 Spore germination protein A3 [Moorella glycerini]
MRARLRLTLALFLLALMLPGLAGCWSRHEIEELAIVMAVALDAVPGDQVRLSVYVAIPRTIAGGPSMGGGAGGEPPKAGEVISATGSDFAQAARRLEDMVPRRLLWAQNRVLILGEELARQGFHYLDHFTRERQMRLTTPVLVTRGEARKVLELPPGIELMPGTILTGILRNRTTFKVELKDLLAMWEAPGDNPVLPQVVMTPTPEQESREVRSDGDDRGQKGGNKEEGKKKPPEAVAIKGAGAFRDDRLIGWLDERETSGLMWLRGEVREGVITVTLPAQAGGRGPGQASVIFHRASTEVKSRVEGSQVTFNVAIRGDCDLTEATVSLNPDRPEHLAAIQEAVNRAVEERVLAAVGRAQQEIRADIFGLGETLHRSNVRYWRQVQDRWNEEFTRAKIQVKVDLYLNRLGMTNRTPGKTLDIGGKGATQGRTR